MVRHRILGRVSSSVVGRGLWSTFISSKRSSLMISAGLSMNCMSILVGVCSA